jgi:hypothetical protein
MCQGYPNPLDIIAVSEVTRWPLSDLQRMTPDELKFWVAKTAEFVKRRNEAIKAEQEKARRKNNTKPAARSRGHR